MKKTVTGIMVAKVVALLGSICSIAMLIASLLELVETETSTWIMFLGVNIAMLSFCFAISNKKKDENKKDDCSINNN